MFHTRDLRYFIAVAEHLHFTRAAASLFVTQPALSKQIASLERGLGVELFVRRSDGITLTSAGAALLPYARQMVDLDEKAVVETRRAAHSSRKLTIGFWLAPAHEVLAGAISAFAAVEPDVRLGIRRADWGEAGAGLVAFDADVALVQTPHDRPLRGLGSHRLAVEDIVVAVALEHRLAGRDYVDISELNSETVLTVPPSNGQVWQMAYQRSTSARPAHVEYVTTIDETLDAVAVGLGVGLLTPSIAAIYSNPQVCTVSLRGIEPSDYCVVWRSEDERRPAVQHLVECIVGAYHAWSGRLGQNGHAAATGPS
jgi:DNA-binding transcriptional LysR family regulator